MESSECRGIQNCSSATTESHQSPQAKKSYASATSTEVFPSKEQAIVIDATDKVTIKEYINKVASIISASNIRFVSRISNNRICMFLASKEIADNLTKTHKDITINDIVLNIRPLISNHKRIIISNVCPIIPHEVIEIELAKRNIKATSKISFLRAGMNDPGFSHIMSFRRQVYIHHDDTNKLPEAIPIQYDDTTYWI